MKKISFKNILREQGILKTSKNKVLVDAIVNRHPITFWYSGPKKEVKSGRRIEGEPVALGLSKKGNLIIRTYVQPPSVSKKGFNEHGWRTFMVGRMSKIEVNQDKTFDIKREKYKEGNDNSMTVTYVTSDWNNKKPLKQKKDIVEPVQKSPISVDRPEVPQKEKPEQTPPISADRPEVPQREKPPVNPEQITKNHIDGVFNGFVNNKIKTIEDKKTISPDEYNEVIKQLYNLKKNDWINYQKEIGGNTSPGEGTRKRLEKDSKTEVDTKLNNEKIVVNYINNELQENLKRIKSLMF